MNALLAAVVVGGGDYSLGQIAIAIVIIAAVVALVYVALRQFGIQIPAWVQQVFWIVVVAFVVIVAIKFVLSM
jgi:hypothetical protein